MSTHTIPSQVILIAMLPLTDLTGDIANGLVAAMIIGLGIDHESDRTSIRIHYRNHSYRP